MRDKLKKYFSMLDDYIKQYNKLLQMGINYLLPQMDCLRLGIDTITRCQVLLLDYYTEYVDKIGSIDIQGITLKERYDYDYKISEYAEKFYQVANNFKENVDKMFLKDEEKNIYASEELTKAMQIFSQFIPRVLSISARWRCRRFIEYYEYEKKPRSKKIPKRLPLLNEAFFFCDRMIATKIGITFKDKIMPKRVIFAVQPNAGKSFVANVFCIIGLILHKIYYKSSGIIRITNTGKNAIGFSRLCKNMITDTKIADIYPELKKYVVRDSRNKCLVLEKEPDEEWLLKDLDNSVRASMFALGRESAINGMRNDVALVIDDISDGFDQMNNDQAHTDMVNKYDIDMDSRKEDENVPELIIGTMFNENGLQSVLIKRAIEKYGELQQCKIKGFDNSFLTKDNTMAVVLVDCFNSKMESIAPQLISTEKLLDKMNSMVDYQFNLVYRQKEGSREPKVFEYDTLKTYAKGDNAKLKNSSICVLDPTRKKGQDYFVIGCFRLNEKTNDYRLVKTICKQKSLGKIADPKNDFAKEVTKFLIENNCTTFYIENNTSNLIGSFIEKLLKEKQYNFCKIEEVYNTENKRTRILDMEATIKNNIEFPNKKAYAIKSDMYVAMNIFTKWDESQFGKKGNYDDVADMVAMFAKKFIYSVKRKAQISAKSLPNCF